MKKIIITLSCGSAVDTTHTLSPEDLADDWDSLSDDQKADRVWEWAASNHLNAFHEEVEE